MELKKQIYRVIRAAIEAGDAIMGIYQKNFDIDFKEDASPLTEADRKSDEIIKSMLKDTYPIISEESKTLPFNTRKGWDRCWLVDPLDGTKEFIKRNGEFTVNIALIEKGSSILGVVYLPVFRVLYLGVKGIGSYKYALKENEEDVDTDKILNAGINLSNIELPDIYTIVASRSHMSKETEDFIDTCRETYGEVVLVSKGSSIKLCLVAEGTAHAYPRIAPTMEWDTAAAHAVAKYAGCEVLDFHTGKELTYNKENLLNPHFVVTWHQINK